MYLSVQKRKRFFGVLAGMAASLLMVTASAHEHTEDGPGVPSQPQLTLSAQASAEVPQDTVKITLASELVGASQASVAAKLGKALDSVLKQAKTNEKVRVSSGNYQVWPVNDKYGKISNWHGRGEIILESTDFVAASDLAGELSDRASIVSLRFFVSPRARAKEEQALLTQAAQAFRDRAQAATLAFGFSSYSVRNIDLNGAGAPFQPAVRMMSMAADKSAAPLEGGVETVTVSVHGSIFLHSPKK